VVADTRSLDLQKAPVLMVYVPYWVRSREQVSLVARTAGDPRAEESALRAAVWSVDRSVPVSQMRTMTQVMDESVGGRRFQMLLIAVFAATALLLASIGIYGVLAYSVARRTGEIGIRVALGARPADLCGMVLRQGLAPVVAGLLAGLAAALAVGRLLHALLFDVSAADPVTIVTVIVVLFAIAVLACIMPARRAMRVDPMTALRFE
jgi:putative ABC transport system permease protein